MNRGVITLLGLAVLSIGYTTCAAQKPPAAGPDWDAIYSQKKQTLLTDFCKAPDTKAAPLCNELTTRCVGFTVEQCNELISPSPLSQFVKKVLSNTDVVGGAASVLVAILGVITLWLRRKLKRYKDFLEDGTSEYADRERLDRQDTINIVLVGEGGSGKTSIIRSIAAMSKADPAVPTMASAPLYCISSEVSVIRNKRRLRRRIALNIQDYRGQITQDLLKSSIVLARNGAMTAIVLVIDLFPPVKKGSLQLPARKPDPMRVAGQLKKYGLGFLELLEGLLRENLIGFLIFVNKVDLLDLKPTDAQGVARDAVQPLYDEIVGRFETYRTRVIIGSAKLGQGVSGFDGEDGVPDTLLESIIQLAKLKKEGNSDG